ncbi:hypothetical protein HK097_002316 [Rhizophlyctis rosea]|uniref:Uncharacterized protein n=1 Tax=Rhizophlyctis rosea TaxID=64517 RepID=A0AAD5SKD1_9FUNG|nr:hypothetical protein HK097_002316 [Rhizophlyctis rosea]
MQPKTLIAILAFLATSEAVPLERRQNSGAPVSAPNAPAGQVIPGVEALLGNTAIPTVQGTSTTALDLAGGSAPQPLGGIINGLHGGAKPVVGQVLGGVKGGVGLTNSGSPVGGNIVLKKRQNAGEPVTAPTAPNNQGQIIPGANAALENTVIPTVQGTGTTALDLAGGSLPQPLGSIVNGVHSGVKPVVNTVLNTVKGAAGLAQSGSPVGGNIHLKKRQNAGAPVTAPAAPNNQGQVIPGAQAALENTVIPTVQGTGTTGLDIAGGSLPQPLGGIVNGAHSGAKPVVGQVFNTVKGAVGLANAGSPVGGNIHLKKRAYRKVVRRQLPGGDLLGGLGGVGGVLGGAGGLGGAAGGAGGNPLSSLTAGLGGLGGLAGGAPATAAPVGGLGGGLL